MASGSMEFFELGLQDRHLAAESWIIRKLSEIVPPELARKQGHELAKFFKEADCRTEPPELKELVSVFRRLNDPKKPLSEIDVETKSIEARARWILIVSQTMLIAWARLQKEFGWRETAAADWARDEACKIGKEHGSFEGLAHYATGYRKALIL